MDDAPSNLDIARQIGITELEVARYRGDTFRLSDGAWLIHFKFQMPKELRKGLTGSFTLLCRAPQITGDARAPEG